MKNNFVISFFLIVFLCPFVNGFSQEKEIVLTPRNNESNQIKYLKSGDEWIITTKGHDPYFFLDAEDAVDINQNYIFSFESFNTTEMLPLVIFVGNVLDNNHLVEGCTLPRTEGWAANGYDISITIEPPQYPFTSIRVRFGNSSGKTFRARNFRLRTPTEQEKELAMNREQLIQEDKDLAFRLRNYLDKDFESRIMSVQVSYHSNKITIEGIVNSSNMKNIGLIEIPMWEDAVKLNDIETFIPVKEKKFALSVDRNANDGRDRLLSSWAIAEKIAQKDGIKYRLLSSSHYVEDIIPRANLEKKSPVSKKGIGGCPLNHPDIKDLGIASVTFNIILDQILFTDSGNGRIPYEYAGKTWYIDSRGIERIDETVRLSKENNLMVSAILLIPLNRSGEKHTWSGKVAYPEAGLSAAFAMPYLSTKEGVEAYSATINFLTERYSNDERGRIHHWIVHNEIQNGFYWTSAGQKNLETYMNLYQKSMRIVQSFARLYDPNAKALISLDHDWNITGDLRGYKGKDLLDCLVQFCKQEGNFEWGIAFHPYPQDINNPRTWEDKEATFSYDTPYLTPKNLEVIDAWASQPHVLYRNKGREIQFTEQGLNSPDYSEKSLKDQAAGMVYTWEKVDKLRNVTAYQYHLWADAYEEGGLRLGLRKYWNAEGDPHGKKPIWDVVRNYDTPNWNETKEPYKSVLDIRDWSDIIYKGVLY